MAHVGRLAAVISAALAAFAVGAHAQTPPDPPYKPLMTPPTSTTPLSTEKQSPVNPFPFSNGNAQNRGWAASDNLWGVLDANVPFEFAVPGRAAELYNGLIQLTGWTLPRMIDPQNTIDAPLPLSDPNSETAGTPTPFVSVTAFTDGITQGTEFATVPQPLPSGNVTSTIDGVNPDYYEAAALPRPAQAAIDYDATQKFVWRLDNPAGTIGPSGLTTAVIPGAAGAQVAYRIFVHIPTPSNPVGITAMTGEPENRIDDARYTVYYYVFSGGQYLARQQVCYASQISGGDYELVAPDGSTLTFPFLTTATFTAAGTPSVAVPAQGGLGLPQLNTPLIQGVVVDNTTSDTTLIDYVLADSITLEPNFDTITATPTIVSPHGGVKMVTTGLGTAAAPVQPAPYLPDNPDPYYNTTANAPHQPDPNNVFGDTSTTYSFINDINDPAYAGANYANYVPWDPSTTFMGPRSLIDPRYSGTDMFGIVWNNVQVGPMINYNSVRPTIARSNNPANPVPNSLTIQTYAQPRDATNNLPYPAPYFSHAQVLIAKTSYLHDPEYGVPDDEKTGTKTTAVSAIYALDSVTGVQLWRFPDRTYLPQGATLNGNAILGAGDRNPNEGTDITGMPVFLVPGIVALDVNGDGLIEDNEVYIGSAQTVAYNGATYTVTAGNNTSGATNASVTFAPRIMVQGAMQVPTHNLAWTPTTTGGLASDYNGVVAATPGRYYNPGAANYGPVPVGMAFIASGNGVMYAVDAYGNNDTRYYPGDAIGTSTASPYYGYFFGAYQPGTTNLFYTFSETNHPQQSSEMLPDYYKRLKTEIPATGNFGASAPVLGWNLTDTEMALATPPATPKLRLFVGNTNGVLYAMDPNGDAGTSYGTDPVTMKPVPDGVQTFPFIKGAQVDTTQGASYYGNLGGGNYATDLQPHAADLAWWYRTQGSINFTPAVSPIRHNQTAFSNGASASTGLTAKGVYVSSSEGRVYCLDWDGPESVGTEGAPLIFDGTAGTSTLLNDDIYNHNTIPDESNNTSNIADGQQGTVRPRWTFPNLYRSNSVAGSTKTQFQVTDPAIGVGPNAGAISGKNLAEPSTLGPIQNAPMLMDFWWSDPDIPASGPTLQDFLVVVANDPTTSGAPATESRVYLLDQIGDCVNYLTNPVVSEAGVVISQPRDKYSPKVLLASATDATMPVGAAWSYRYMNEAYPATGATPNQQDINSVQMLNMPIFDLVNGNYDYSIYTYDPAVPITFAENLVFPGAAGNFNNYVHQPSRRMLPTVFIGGIGSVYALDIDPETGLFMRWRPTLAEQELFTPLSDLILAGTTAYPGDPNVGGTIATDDEVLPVDPIFTNTTTQQFNGYTRSQLQTQAILARVMSPNDDGSNITQLTIGNGPNQNRNNFIPEAPATAVTLPSVPASPTNDVPNLLPFAIATVTPPTAPAGPDTVTTGNGTTIGTSATNSTVDFNGLPSAPMVTTALNIGGHITGLVNQDVNDPSSTKRGAASAEPSSSPGNYLPNDGFQYPILIASTVSSYVHGLSTNLDGQDRMTPDANPPLNPSTTVGWGFAAPGDPNLQGTRSQQLFSIQGPGGLSGTAIFSNVYYPAVDPFATAYRNAASGTSLDVSPNLIADEPNTTIPTPSGTGAAATTEEVTQPRPDFHPRPFVLAQVAAGATAPTTTTDTDTGQTGFPLSLNGLFFDPQFAGAGGATQFPPVSTVNGYGYSTLHNLNSDGQHPFGDYHIWPRVPAYSNIGARLSNPAVAAGLAYADTNDQTPDGVRRYELPAEGGGTDAQLPPLPVAPIGGGIKDGDVVSDDINPAGQDVAWFYTGSLDGTAYAYTPVISGYATGLEGGNHAVGYGSRINGGLGLPFTNASQVEQPAANGTQPQVDLFTQAYVGTMLADLNAAAGGGSMADRNNWQNNSVAALGGKNYYEWGDTAYIVAYDLLAQPNVNITSSSELYVRTLTQMNGAYPVSEVDRSVTISFTNSDGTSLPPAPVSLAGTGDTATQTVIGGNVLAYYRDNVGNWDGYNWSAPPANEVPLGIAILRLPIGLQTGASTPGSQIQVRVKQAIMPITVSQPQNGVGDNASIQNLNNPSAFFKIANPLAVQGWLTGTAPSQAAGQIYATVQSPTNGYGVNGVGPFEAASNVLPGQGSPKLNSSTKVDPNITGGEYWQALANGNSIRRTDDNPYLMNTAVNPPIPVQPLQPNPNYGTPIIVNGQGAEPTFFMPVAASLGYVNHGTSGTTATASNQENFRLANRSDLLSVTGIRVQAATFLFRAWPGTIMNAIANPTNNPRLTPGEGSAFGMADSGQINPLPWETVPNEARPFSSSVFVNNSPDYPDIAAHVNNAVQVIGPSGDMTLAPGALPAHVVFNGGNAINNWIYGMQIQPDQPLLTTADTAGDNESQFASQYATFVSLTVPKHQAANLVAAHSLTNTYYPANPLDFTGTNLNPDYGAAPGPLQLPRGVQNRLLTAYNPSTQSGSNVQALTPFGYTSRMAAFVDTNLNGSISTQVTAYNRTTGTDLNNTMTSQVNGALKPYREFEVWAGVPADESLSIAESVIDLGSLPHGFGMENGLLGYNPALTDARMFGLIPPAISNNAEYANFFKTFTVQNNGNVNLINLRATQKVEAVGGNGSGAPFYYFQMQAKGVNPAFGFDAANADPYLPGVAPYVNASTMPTIVTALDQVFDARWDAYNAANFPAAYSNYYRLFGGRHVLPKANPNQGPTVLGIPALPTNQTLSGGPSNPLAPSLAVGIPLGTPFGTYSSTQSGSPFAVFEDHDTAANALTAGAPSYQATPFIPNAGAPTLTPNILAAGPLYGGQNRNPYSGTAPTGNTPAPLTILSNGGTNNNGVWRAEAYNATTNTYQYLPYSYPYLNIKAQITETAITSGFPDLALTGGINTPSIVTGELPGADPFPVVTVDTSTGTTVYRPSSAVTPASFRDMFGNFHIYWSRNDKTSSGSGGANTPPYGAQPSAPFVLRHAELPWDAPTGSWKANSIGTEISAPASSTGQWLTTQTTIPSTSINPNPAGQYESNTSPFVLIHQSAMSNSGATWAVDKATLFFLDTVPTTTGAPINNIYYTDVTTDGIGAAPQPYFLNPDPSILRYAPRAVYDAANSQDFLMYYGGVAGRWSIYYVPRAATNGVPGGYAQDASVTPGVELQLPLPAAIVSATEPAPVYRTLTTANGTQNIVDVYYTGISRATQTPDIYMNRYIAAPGSLTLAALPAVTNDLLAGGGRQNLWRAQNIGWIVNGQNGAALPTVNWTHISTNGTFTALPANWKYDTSSGLLYQTVGTTPQTLTYVSVDAAAGTVRFRGGSAPSIGDKVMASYTPQTSRLTSDGAGNYGSTVVMDPQILQPTPTGHGYVLRRLNPIESGRKYVLWQKGGQASHAPTLYDATLRVGVDLMNPASDPAAPNPTPNPNALGPTQSIELSQAPQNSTTTADQTPLVQSVVVNGTSIPFDVDFNRNRIYVAPEYENQPVDITYTQATPGQQGGTNNPNGVQVTLHSMLTYIDELNVGAPGTFGSALSMVAGINEGQASAVIDLLDPTQISGFKTRNDPPSAGDPTLQPGRVYIFWTSPRGKAGQAAQPDIYPTAFNLYWETIAPDFDGLQLYTPITRN